MRVKKNLTSLILASLEKSIDGYVKFEDFINHPQVYFYGYPRILNKPALSKALKRLREKGWVDFVSEDDLLVKLTDLGKEKAILASLHIQDQQWDKRWRIVIFDIPEKRRAARDLLRSKLKQWEFAPWQKSVWVTKKNCTKPLREFIKQAGIEDWVMVIESDNIGRDS